MSVSYGNIDLYDLNFFIYVIYYGIIFVCIAWVPVSDNPG